MGATIISTKLKYDPMMALVFYKNNILEIKNLAKAKCKTGRENWCSLQAKIMYDDEKDLDAIPIMQEYCNSNTKDMSQRCTDLTEFYLGLGPIQPKSIDVSLAEKFAKKCLLPDSAGLCYMNAIKFLYAKNISTDEAKRIAYPLLKSALSGKGLNNKGIDRVNFILNCKLEIVIEKPKVASIGHIASWVRYKNLSNYPLQFSGELKAVLTNDSTKVFVSQFVGKTLSYSRKLNPGELIREEATFQVDDNKSSEYLPFFQIKQFQSTNLVFSDLEAGSLADRFCNFAVKIEN